MTDNEYQDAKDVIVVLRAQLERITRERDEWKRANDTANVAMHAAWSERDEALATIDATWIALGVIGRGRGVTLPERAARVVAARDALHARISPLLSLTDSEVTWLLGYLEETTLSPEHDTVRVRRVIAELIRREP